MTLVCPTVSLIVSTYLLGEDAARRADSLVCVLASLRCQTFRDWDALVVHNGPFDADLGYSLRMDVNDTRIRVVCAPEAKGQWGHPWRLWGARQTLGRYVGFCNDDGYYAPPYLQRLVTLLNGGADLALCDFVHGFPEHVPDYPPYRPVVAGPRVGSVNVGGFLARRELVLATPWEDFGVLGDGRYVEALARGAKGGWRRCAELLHVTN